MVEKKIRALRTWFGIFFSFIFLSKMCHPVRQQYPKLPHSKGWPQSENITAFPALPCCSVKFLQTRTSKNYPDCLPRSVEAERLKRWKARFYWAFCVFCSAGFRGPMVAIAWVGQRDTRWSTPLTVSGGYQGEEGNRKFGALQTIPRL
jgi:hypothetical protein